MKEDPGTRTSSAEDRHRGAPWCTVDPLRHEDVDEAVGVHLEAFRGYMNAALGRRYIRAFLSWFCTAIDGIAFGARAQGSLVGYVVGAPTGYGGRLNRDLALVAAGSLAFRPWLGLRSDIRRAVGARLRVLVEGFGSSKKEGGECLPVAPTVSLVGIGVASVARGKGVGASLMAAFEAEAKSRGMKSMRLSVYPQNRAASRMYERAGWEVFDSNEEGIVYYTKDLKEDN